VDHRLLKYMLIDIVLLSHFYYSYYSDTANSVLLLILTYHLTIISKDVQSNTTFT